MVSCWEQGVGTRLDSHERPCQENGISCSNGEGLYVDFFTFCERYKCNRPYLLVRGASFKFLQQVELGLGIFFSNDTLVSTVLICHFKCVFVGPYV